MIVNESFISGSELTISGDGEFCCGGELTVNLSSAPNYEPQQPWPKLVITPL